jgi:hypothetical protein
VNLLLDTHVLLWWLSEDVRLPSAARQLIAEEAQSVFVSTASLWEISLKAAKGKLRADLRQIDHEIQKGNYIFLPVDLLSCCAYRSCRSTMAILSTAYSLLRHQKGDGTNVARLVQRNLPQPAGAGDGAHRI